MASLTTGSRLQRLEGVPRFADEPEFLHRQRGTDIGTEHAPVERDMGFDDVGSLGE